MTKAHSTRFWVQRLLDPIVIRKEVKDLAHIDHILPYGSPHGPKKEQRLVNLNNVHVQQDEVTHP
jgi:hypothetical protein